MLYITEQDALKLWDYIEGETNRLENRTDKLEEKYKERRGDRQTADNFAIEWWANITARRNAIQHLRSRIHTARSSFDTVSSLSVPVSSLSLLIDSALDANNPSNFQAANLVRTMELDAIRAVLSKVLRHTIKDTEV